MRINKDYRIREIAGETIIVKQGTMDVNTTYIISLNESARLLYEQLCGKDFTMEDAATVLATTYGIPMEQAQKDASTWIEALKKCNVIE